MMGDGTMTFFWTDLWLDETPLCQRFPRLFDLAENGSSTVAEVFRLGWGIGGGGEGVAETVVGLGGGAVERVSDITSRFFLVGTFPR
jgi:hypothetical protein